MNTLENTISMLRVLPESDLIEIQKFTRTFFKRYQSETTDESAAKFLKPLSRNDFLQNVKVAEQEIAEGKSRSAKEVLDELECRYRL